MPRRNSNSESNWVSFSDLMTGLMVVFMFIAISYIVRVYEYEYVSTEIYNSIKVDFKEEIEKDEIDLSNDGTVRFNTKRKGEELFALASSELTPRFKSLLSEFIPRYLDIITDSTYLDNIKEIRIEGHADNTRFKNSGSGTDNYFKNLELSSSRAQRVLRFLKEHQAFKELPERTRLRLEFLFTANGMSYSRTLNDEKELSYLSENKDVSKVKSRRVEFRVVTSSDKLIQKAKSNF